MSPTTYISLGNHFKGFLLRLNKAGRYGSASEAVRAALRVLEEEGAKYVTLMKAWEEGEESGECAENFDDIVRGAIAEH